MELEKFMDEFGPEKVIEVYDPKTKLKGILVIDSNALGPGKGGIRMTPSVNVVEVFRLARAMTWKNSLAELPFGGAKSGIIANPQDINNKERKKELIQGFSRALKIVCPKYYIAGPDVNTTEQDMQWFAEANGNWNSCTGKPSNYCEDKKCGLPHELGSTGFGVAQSTVIAAKHTNLDINNLTVAIEGFGNVGTFTSKFLEEYGAKIIAVSDSKGVIYNKSGLNIDRLLKVKEKEGSVIKYKPGKVLPNKKLFELDVNVLIPGALPDVITKENVNKIKAKIVVEAANIPTTPQLEEHLHKRGILVVPDFVANAGGVISSYAEYRGYPKKRMFELVEGKIKRNTKLVLEESKNKKIIPRNAAMLIAQKRVRDAMKKRG